MTAVHEPPFERPKWMDDESDAEAEKEPWPTDAPGSEQILDYCARLFPVFNVTSSAEEGRWDAIIQFLSASDAAAFEQHVKAEPSVLG